MISQLAQNRRGPKTSRPRRRRRMEKGAISVLSDLIFLNKDVPDVGRLLSVVIVDTKKPSIAMKLPSNMRLGAHAKKDGTCEFLLWAPFAERVEIQFPKDNRASPMSPAEGGYFYALVDAARAGTHYKYLLYARNAPPDAEPLVRPDPASRCQPDGVHGVSEVISDEFVWHDEHWHGLPLTQCIIYEAHVGLMSRQGTFDGVAAHLDDLISLGVTALELMPIGEFPGARNWGYDTAYPFAAHCSYGGHEALKRLVDACHRKGLAVILDVVYNHFGPEGCYLADFGPYFTDAYFTPWGNAVNFDGPDSAEVRRYFIENALYWIDDCHVDALRLDAVHAIYDFSARPFLEELASAVETRAEALNRTILCIAESDLNDTRVIRPRGLGGFGFDAQWNDDFHHALHTLLTGEQNGYYIDYGSLGDFARAWREGYAFSGQYSKHRRRPHGNSSRNIPARQFVVFIQNHDQIGNRMLGDRLEKLLSFDELKVAAAAVLLSPFIPLLFMGEEYAEPSSFPYFVSHLDAGLIQAVREGRRKEFSTFGWEGEIPDPQDEGTFAGARLNWELRARFEKNKRMLAFYQELIRLRRSIPSLAHLSKRRLAVVEDETNRLLCVRRWFDHDEVLIVLGFNDRPAEVSIPFGQGSWRKLLDASDARWSEKGGNASDEITAGGLQTIQIPPHAALLWQREIKLHLTTDKKG